jgi:hypothetical protein
MAFATCILRIFQSSPAVKRNSYLTSMATTIYWRCSNTWVATEVHVFIRWSFSSTETQNCCRLGKGCMKSWIVERNTKGTASLLLL